MMGLTINDGIMGLAVYGFEICKIDDVTVLQVEAKSFTTISGLVFWLMQ